MTRFEYDDLYRLEREIDPLGNATAYTYDAVGNRISLRDAAGFTTTYGYDEAHRLLTIDYPAPDPDVSFTYDALGNRATMQDGVGTTLWSEFDALNRVLAVTDPFGETVRYGYDRAGNRTRLTYPDGKVVSYAYDPADRLMRVTDWDGQDTAYTYDAADQLASVLRPNGVATSVAYDAAGRLLELRHTREAETLASFVYRYDAVGNRAQAVEIVRQPAIVPPGPYRVYLPLVMAGGRGSDGSVRIDYRYDALYRLTAADYSSREFFHYTYDAVGNRLTQETHKGVNRYVYDAADRLTSVDGVAYVWDAKGNLLSDGARAYTHPARNVQGERRSRSRSIASPARGNPVSLRLRDERPSLVHGPASFTFS